MLRAPSDVLRVQTNAPATGNTVLRVPKNVFRRGSALFAVWQKGAARKRFPP